MSRHTEHHPLASLLAASADAVVSRDLEGRITGWNAGAEHLLGYAAHEMVGQPFTCLLPAQHAGDAEAELRRFQQGERLPGRDCLWLGKDGAGVEVSLSLAPLWQTDGVTLIGVAAIARDITPSKKAASLLHASEERLRLALDSAEIGTWCWNFRTDQDTRDASLNRILGLRAVDSTQSVNEYLARIHPDDRSRVRQALMRTLQEGCPLDQEYRIVRHDGVVRWIRTRGKLILGPRGEPSCLTGIILDITDRKQAQEALQWAHDDLEVRVRERTAELESSNQRLRAEINERQQAEQLLYIKNWAMESSINGIALVNLEEYITYANPAFLHLWGYEHPAAVVGRPARLFWQDRDAFARVLSTLRRRGDWAGELVALRQDGSTFEVHLSINLVKDRTGKPICLMGSFVDITERKRAEAELRDSATRTHAIVTTAMDAILTFDEQGILESINPAGEKLFGQGASDLIGRPVQTLIPSLVAPPVADAPGSPLVAGLGEPGASATGGELQGQRRDGGCFPITLSVGAMQVGPRKMYTCIVHDLTEWRRLQDQLVQSRKLEAIGQLAGGVAHDFNNILTVMMGCGEVLAEEIKKNGPAHELVKEILSAGQRASTITRQLLAFGRRQRHSPVLVSLNRLVGDIEKFLYRLIGEDIHLVARLDPELGPIQADPGQIEQVLLNLVVNARDAMPRGGRLTLESTRSGRSRKVRFNHGLFPCSHRPAMAWEALLAGAGEKDAGTFGPANGTPYSCFSGACPCCPSRAWSWASCCSAASRGRRLASACCSAASRGRRSASACCSAASRARRSA